MKSKHKSQAFLVNTLGEVFSGQTYLLGSVCVGTVARKVLTASQFTQWAKHLGHRSKLEAKVDKAINAEFRKRAKKATTAAEYTVWREITRLQAINDSRFRVYGGIDKHGKPWISLVTEFCAFVDDRLAWKTVREAAKTTGAVVRQMSVHDHMDKYSPPQGKRGEKVHPADAGGTVWATGPNHGRAEKQVELSWDVRGLGLPQLRAKVSRLSRITEALFQAHGVSVI